MALQPHSLGTGPPPLTQGRGCLVMDAVNTQGRVPKTQTSIWHQATAMSILQGQGAPNMSTKPHVTDECQPLTGDQPLWEERPLPGLRCLQGRG